MVFTMCTCVWLASAACRVASAWARGIWGAAGRLGLYMVYVLGVSRCREPRAFGLPKVPQRGRRGRWRGRFVWCWHASVGASPPSGNRLGCRCVLVAVCCNDDGVWCCALGIRLQAAGCRLHMFCFSAEARVTRVSEPYFLQVGPQGAGCSSPEPHHYGTYLREYSCSTTLYPT